MRCSWEEFYGSTTKNNHDNSSTLISSNSQSYYIFSCLYEYIVGHRSIHISSTIDSTRVLSELNSFSYCSCFNSSPGGSFSCSGTGSCIQNKVKYFECCAHSDGSHAFISDVNNQNNKNQVTFGNFYHNGKDPENSEAVTAFLLNGQILCNHTNFSKNYCYWCPSLYFEHSHSTVNCNYIKIIENIQNPNSVQGIIKGYEKTTSAKHVYKYFQVIKNQGKNGSAIHQDYGPIDLYYACILFNSLQYTFRSDYSTYKVFSTLTDQLTTYNNIVFSDQLSNVSECYYFDKIENDNLFVNNKISCVCHGNNYLYSEFISVIYENDKNGLTEK